jgi:hypothetical protein
MNIRAQSRSYLFIALLLTLSPALLPAEEAKVTLDWNKVVATSKTTPTLQVVVNPMLRRGAPMHDQSFQALKDLNCDYVRYVPWLPYPRLGVAELEPPKDGKTSWDFSLIDPMTEDFINATKGHSVILNFSTIPQWMFKTEKPVTYPADPDQVFWNYTQGTEFRDPSMKEAAEYYKRLISWYTKGGFTDEFGKRHDSGHNYKIDYWEVLNEVDFEHEMTPETYTKFYDAVVLAMREVQPQMKFVGMALAMPLKNPRFFEYFLNPKNHKPGVPLDMISYHFYATPKADETFESKPFTFFDQAERFVDVAGYIESIRKRLSPNTQTTINELGSIDNSDFGQNDPGFVHPPLPDAYWNLSGAVYAYLYAELARQGIDIAGESQLVGYPTQFPSVTMIDWKSGKPNARYWVLKLLHDNFGPGDKLVSTSTNVAGIHAQAFVTSSGGKKVLLLSKRAQPVKVTIPGAAGAEVHYVDQTTKQEPPAAARLDGDKLDLGGFGVAVLILLK